MEQNQVVACVMLGGGGHARMLLDCLEQVRNKLSIVILDADPSQWGNDILGVPIVGPDEQIAEFATAGARYFLVGVGSASDCGPRRRLFQIGINLGLQPLAVRHPSAVVSPHARLGPGVQLLPGCVVNLGAELGANVIINSGAVVEHDCKIGDHVHIATGAVLASTVEVGEAAHIGAGATVRQCIRIGTGAVVGAGAVVVKDVSDRTTVTGLPAQILERA